MANSNKNVGQDTDVENVSVKFRQIKRFDNA